MDLTVLPRHSLKTRIMLATLAIFLVSIWLLSFYASQLLRKDMQHLLGDQQFSMVSVVASQLNRELEGRRKALETVAALSAQALQEGGAASMQAVIEQRPTLQMLFNGGIFVTGIDGTAIASVPRSAERVGINFMERNHIAAALREGKSIVSEPVIGKQLRAPVVSMAAPIRNAQGQIVGTLAGVINLSQPNFVDEVTESHYGKAGGYLLVAPQHRLIVTASDKRRIMEKLPAPGINPGIDSYIQGYEGSTVLVNPQGVEMLVSAKGVPAAGWYVAATLPTTEAFAPIREMQQRVLMATLFLTLLAAGLTWWMLRRQLMPLLDAVETLSEISDENQSAKILPVSRHDEIGQLIGTFNRLLESLWRRETVLRESEARLQATFDASLDGIISIDTHGCLIDFNPAAEAIFGWKKEEILGRTMADLLVPERHRSAHHQGLERFIHTRSTRIMNQRVEMTALRRDGSEFPIELTVTNVQQHGRDIFTASIRDITENKKSEEKLKLAASVFTHAREGIMIASADGQIIEVNDACCRITSYCREELVGQNPRILSSGRQDSAFYAALWHDLNEKGHWYGEVWNRRKNGEVYAVMQTISAARDDQGAIGHYVGLFSDITALKEHQSQLEHIAHFDALTNLPNRVLLADRMRQAMTQTVRRGQPVAVVYLDLDGFKSINDKHGHETGDRMLIALANRMKQSLREGDTLARLGGDEFVAVLVDLTDVDASVPMLERLLGAAAEPVQVGEIVLQVSASLGVTFYPQPDEVDADQLLRQSDQAMYQAKLAGKSRYHIFDAERDRSVRGHHESLERIRIALARREFVLYYQPKVNMRTGEIIGAEALIRWQHPERGLLLPAEFLPVIEDHPLAVDIGEWVINTALLQMEAWQAAGLDVPISVNVGARQLQQVNFVLRLRDMLADHPGIRPGALELEVLETSALDDLAGVSKVIESCREIGVLFALDDFGTGYSSLTYLKRLSVAQLKIDQSFVRDMLDDPDDLAILVGVLGLATAFRRQVIAEGVETVEHGEMLLHLGCELAQGYGIARPMLAENLPLWAADWRPASSWGSLPAVNHDDLPLLFASVEHRAWMVSFEDFLEGKRQALPLVHHQCRFGAWLETDGRVRHALQPAFQVVEGLHRKIHDLAAELQELHVQDRNAEALTRLGELHALRDEFFAQLQMLMQGSKVV